MATLALNVEILGEFKKLTNATKGAEGTLGKLNDKVNSVSKGIGRAIGGLAVALGFTGIVSGLKDAVRGAEEAKVANDRIDAIAKSMDLFGNNTKRTTDRIKEFADTQELLVGVEAEVIKATQAKLLTFKEVASSADRMGGAFDRATILAQDLAAAGFGEATANATQLGKALNDPTKGITALTRVGLTFTEEQKKVIKSLQDTGDMAGAQTIILEELERQVGGTAAATVTDSQKMALAFGAVSDEIGTALLPLLNEFTTWLTSPAGQETLDDVVQGIKTIITEAAAMVAWVIENKDWLVPMVTAIAGVTAAWKVATAGVALYKGAVALAGAATAGSAAAAGAAAAGGAVAGVAGLAVLGAGAGGYMQGQALAEQSRIYGGGNELGPDGSGKLFGDLDFGKYFGSDKAVQNVTNNITVKTDATPWDIAAAINKANKTSGTTIIRPKN
jgi:hypothetical protein